MSAQPPTFPARVAAPSAPPAPPPDPTLPTPSVPRDTWSKMFNSYGALLVTVIIFALFYLHPADDTTKALAMLAAGFWLGSSNSSQKKDDTITAAQQALATSAPVTKP